MMLYKDIKVLNSYLLIHLSFDILEAPNKETCPVVAHLAALRGLNIRVMCTSSMIIKAYRTCQIPGKVMPISELDCKHIANSYAISYKQLFVG